MMSAQGMGFRAQHSFVVQMLQQQGRQAGASRWHGATQPGEQSGT